MTYLTFSSLFSLSFASSLGKGTPQQKLLDGLHIRHIHECAHAGVSYVRGSLIGYMGVTEFV